MVDRLIADFYKTIDPSASFSEGSERVAKLFIRYEESVEPTELLIQLLEKAPSPKLLEYVIYCFLDSRESDYDTIQYCIKFKRLRKVFIGIQSGSENISDEAYHIYNTIANVCKIGTSDAINIASHVSSGWLDRLKKGERLSDREFLQLGLLIKGEATALKMQSDWVSTNTDAYNMMKMVRLLPMLSSTDELSQRMIETSDKITQGKPVGEYVLTFEYALKQDNFYKWMKKLNKEIPVIAAFLKMLLQQRTKMVPITRLAAVTSLIRFLNESRGSPFEWIATALDKSSKKGFQIELGNSLNRMRAVVQDPAVLYHESVMYGNFSSMSPNNLIGPDRLSKALDSRKEYTIQELVMMGMRNDTLMCRLLDNPKVFNVPRLVEHIAATSRSMTVLLKITQSNVLHSGLINQGVPLALLRNPTHLPIGVLRQFINPRFISLNEMRLLVKNPYGLRLDVLNEIKNVVERKQ